MGNGIQRQRADIRIDSKHSRAICDEIGWHLRRTLAADYAALPPALAVLLGRIVDIELTIDAPSLAPAMDDLSEPSETQRQPATVQQTCECRLT